MLLSRDYVGYMAKEVVKRLVAGKMIEAKNAESLTQQVRQLMADEIGIEDRLNEEVRDSDIAGFFRDDNQELRAWLEALGRRAVQASAPFSDNSTAAVLRWHG